VTDEEYRKWDVILKAIGGLGLVLTAAIGVGEYYVNAGQTATLETNRLDSDQHKLYFDKQLQYYLDVTEAVATIATTHDKRKREELTQKFDALYYGPMVILEDRADSPDATKRQPDEKYTNDANVERHMVAVHDCLLKNCSDGEMEQESLALADTCRFALSLNWASRVQNLKQGLDFKQRLGIKPDQDK
jgi:hypothetical protein